MILSSRYCMVVTKLFLSCTRSYCDGNIFQVWKRSLDGLLEQPVRTPRMLGIVLESMISSGVRLWKNKFVHPARVSLTTHEAPWTRRYKIDVNLEINRATYFCINRLQISACIRTVLDSYTEFTITCSFIRNGQFIQDVWYKITGQYNNCTV